MPAVANGLVTPLKARKRQNRVLRHVRQSFDMVDAGADADSDLEPDLDQMLTQMHMLMQMLMLMPEVYPLQCNPH